MDAVIGIEGDGPNSGEPRKIGAIPASGSCAHIDVVAAHVIGLVPIDIPTIKAEVERGLLNQDFEGIEVKGESIESFEIKDFKLPSTFASVNRKRTVTITRQLTRMMRAYTLRPVAVKELCVACGRCVRVCPIKAVQMHNGKAKVHHSDCIGCYTCHEMCTSPAIVLIRSMSGKVAARLVER